jgi:ribosomal protein L11
MLQEIAKIKMPDTNTDRIDSVCRMVEGTAMTVGLNVVD